MVSPTINQNLSPQNQRPAHWSMYHNGIELGTEFRSEKIPRTRLGTVSVIPRKKVLIPRHSEFRGRANSEARNGIPRKGKFEGQTYGSFVSLTTLLDSTKSLIRRTVSICHNYILNMSFLFLHFFIKPISSPIVTGTSPANSKLTFGPSNCCNLEVENNFS